MVSDLKPQPMEFVVVGGSDVETLGPDCVNEGFFWLGFSILTDISCMFRTVEVLTEIFVVM